MSGRSTNRKGQFLAEAKNLAQNNQKLTTQNNHSSFVPQESTTMPQAAESLLLIGLDTHRLVIKPERGLVQASGRCCRFTPPGHGGLAAVDTWISGYFDPSLLLSL